MVIGYYNSLRMGLNNKNIEQQLLWNEAKESVLSDRKNPEYFLSLN